MKNESGKTSFEIIVTLVVTIVIVGVLIALVYEKPEKKEMVDNNIQVENQDVIDNSENEAEEISS